MQVTEQKIRAALVETFREQGVVLEYEFMLSDAIRAALDGAIGREIEFNNTLGFRKLDEVRKEANKCATIEAARESIRLYFKFLTESDRIREAIQCLNSRGGSIWELAREGKISKEEAARLEKEQPRANHALFLDDKKLTFSIGLTEWGEERKYCSHAREHYAHIAALFKYHFQMPTPALLDFLKTEVIAKEAFGTFSQDGVRVRFFKNGRLDIEGLDVAKVRELNDMMEAKNKGDHMIIYRNI